MRARDIVAEMPTVTLDDSVATAVSTLAGRRLPGLIVVDAGGRPLMVLPGTQVLRLSIGLGYQEGAALTRAVDEEHADTFWRHESTRSIRDCLPPRLAGRATVRGDATLLEVAGVMAREHSPLVAVVHDDGTVQGGISLATLLEHLHLPMLSS